MSDIFDPVAASDSGHPNLDKWNDLLNEIAPKFGVPPNLAKAFIRHESNGNDRIIAALDGGCGLMQITYGVAWDHGVSEGRYTQAFHPKWNGADILDPRLNISVGCERFIKPAMEAFPDNLAAVVCSYNAGIGAAQHALSIGRDLTLVTYGAWYIPAVEDTYGFLNLLSHQKEMSAK